MTEPEEPARGPVRPVRERRARDGASASPRTPKRWPPGLRGRLLLYLLALHAVLLVVLAGPYLWPVRWPLLFGRGSSFLDRGLPVLLAELMLLASLWLGWRLVSALFVPLALVATGADLIEERDFGSTFLPVGQPEMDRLIEIYNHMIRELREERLRGQEQQAFLELLVGASPSGILVCDLDGQLQQINPSGQRLLGQGLLGRAEPCEGLALGRLPAPWNTTLAALEPGDDEVVTLADGSRVRCQAAELRDRGFPRRFFLLDELTDTLRQNEKAAYGKLIRLMSHEVNNSVGAVGSLLAALAYYRDQIDARDRDDFEQAVDVATDRLDRLRAFVEGFAEVVRLPEPVLRPVDLHALVRDLVVLVRPSFAEKGVNIDGPEPVRSTEPGESGASMTVWADREQLEQVLLNVCKNAAEASSRLDGDGAPGLPSSTAAADAAAAATGRVSLQLDRDTSGRPRLRVDDTGPGLDEHTTAELFTPFFTTKAEGRGLGLTLAKEVLERHGFDFSLTSIPGQGSTAGGRFTIVFRPRSAEDRE